LWLKYDESTCAPACVEETGSRSDCERRTTVKRRGY
jgi:hypothetical protein